MKGKQPPRCECGAIAAQGYDEETGFWVECTRCEIRVSAKKSGELIGQWRRAKKGKG